MGLRELTALRQPDRSLHLLDMENLGHGTQCTGQGLVCALHRFEEVAGWAPHDHAVGTASHWFFKRVCFDLPAGLRLLPAGGGADAADLRLIEEGDPSWIAPRFRRVVVGSGDHIFTELVGQLRAVGVVTWAITWRDAMSRDLASAVDEVRYLDDAELVSAEVAA